MRWQLHRNGRFRARLGSWFGGDYELGDRIWRRCLHVFGLAVLLYYVLPPGFFLVVPNVVALLLALGAVLAMEAARLFGWMELPTLRPWEHRRVASYAFYAVALVLAVLAFPRTVAVVVVVGAALVDPLAGELRVRRTASPASLWVVPILTYTVLAALLFVGVGGWRAAPALIAALGTGALATAVERPKFRGYDDDFAMILAPGLALWALVSVWPGFPGLG